MMATKNKTIGYLCGAPKISTQEDSEVSGPRQHVLGITEGFREAGFCIKKFIVGDQWPWRFFAKKIDTAHTRNAATIWCADVIRILSSPFYSLCVYLSFGRSVLFVYERSAAFQSLGKFFKKKVPWILEVNCIESEEAVLHRKNMPLYHLAEQQERDNFFHCDLIVAVSEPLKEKILKFAAIPESKIIIIPNGVDVMCFDPFRYSPKRFFKDFTIGFVGRLLPWQGLDLLMEAIQRLRDEHGMKVCLVVAGGGVAYKKLEAMREDKRLEEQVIFLGQIKRGEVPAIIAGADVCFSCKNLNGQKAYHSPLKLYEYLAMGKPVISSPEEGLLPEEKQKLPLFEFDPKQPDTLVQTIRKVYDLKKEERQALGEKARTFVVSQCTWKTRAAMILEAVAERIQQK